MRQAGIVVGNTLADVARRGEAGHVAPRTSTRSPATDLPRPARRRSSSATTASRRRSARRSTTEIVHGIPSKKAVLTDGDIVSIDFGAIIEGYHGDAAITVPVGEVTPKRARAAAGDRGVAVARHGGRAARRPADRRLAGDRGLHPLPAAPGRVAAGGSSRSTSVTASAPRCTRTRRSTTSSGRGWARVRSSSRGSRLRSSRWSTWAAG